MVFELSRVRAAVFLLLVAPASAFAKKAVEPWSAVVDQGAGYEAIVKALGEPDRAYSASIEEGSRPLHVPISAVIDPDSKAPRILVRVATWEGIAGQEWLVVLKDDRAIYAVAPPMKDEKDAASITKKYGAPRALTAGSMTGDVLRSWEILDVPGVKRMFLRRPGETAIVARLIYR